MKLSPPSPPLPSPRYHHETQCLRTPTVTLTDTFVHARNYRRVAARLHGDCARDELRFRPSAALCDALQHCYDDWERRWGEHEDARVATRVSRAAFPHWREVASAGLVEERERTAPRENNYDGRNYITE